MMVLLVFLGIFSLCIVLVMIPIAYQNAIIDAIKEKDGAEE